MPSIFFRFLCVQWFRSLGEFIGELPLFALLKVRTRHDALSVLYCVEKEYILINYLLSTLKGKIPVVDRKGTSLNSANLLNTKNKVLFRSQGVSQAKKIERIGRRGRRGRVAIMLFRRSFGDVANLLVPPKLGEGMEIYEWVGDISAPKTRKKRMLPFWGIGSLLDDHVKGVLSVDVYPRRYFEKRIFESHLAWYLITAMSVSLHALKNT
jgi:hypothetical protein